MTYSIMPCKVTECWKCGETTMCEIMVADQYEAETGYRDEYAICEECIEESLPTASQPIQKEGE